MRGGAWPMGIFATLLVLLGVLNRIWADSAVQSATFGFAACMSYLAVAWLLAAGREEPLRRGAPPPSDRARAVPASSLGAVVMALGAAGLAFGFVFGEFLVIFGVGLLVAGGWLLAAELTAQRRARRRWSAEKQP